MERIKARTIEEDQDNVPFDEDVVIDALYRLANREFQHAQKLTEKRASLFEQAQDADKSIRLAEARLKRIVESLTNRQI